MKKISNLALICLLSTTGALFASVLVAPARASDCVAHEFGDLGRKGAKLTLAPTAQAPQASGQAEVKLTKAGRTVRIEVRDLPDPTKLRAEYLTFVAWAVPRDGAPFAIGELPADGKKAQIKAVVQAESFGIIVTAEPYFTTSQPSDSVVLQSLVEGKLADKLSTADVECTLAATDRYAFGRSANDMKIVLRPGSKISPELLQARNARRIAQLAGADRLATQPFGVASLRLVEAEEIQARKPGSKEILPVALASIAASDRAFVAALAGQEHEREVAEGLAREERAAAQRASEQARETVRLEARERSARDAELRTIKERQQQLDRDEQADADRRASLQKQAEEQLEHRRSALETARSPVDMSSDLRAERDRLAAERAQLQAENIQAQADLQVERARLDAERATLRAQLALENVARDREENKIARAEIEEARRAAEAARIEAERARREAEVTADRARGEAERSRFEAEVKTQEAERQRLALEAATVPPAVTSEEIQAAREAQIERARLQAELSSMRQVLEQERARAAAEQESIEARQALERTRSEAERAQVLAELERLRVQLDAERTAREAGSQRSELDRAADERRRDQARAALEAERIAFQAEVEAQQKAIAESRDAQARREQEVKAEQVGLEQELAAERAAMQQAAALAGAVAQEQVEANQAERRRARLLAQLTEVLDAKDTERGLVINMSDVSFASGSFQLAPSARTTLARVAGIVLAYPGLTLEIEGHTDSIGSVASNQLLSEKRANSVRDFFLSQGVSAHSMTARGFGADHPVASNDTAAGRSANRRIACVIGGGAIKVTKQESGDRSGRPIVAQRPTHAPPAADR